MDSLTQIALGSAVGVAVMGRRTAVWKAALWGAVGGTLPDLDAFIDHGDAILDMTRHRAESHSLIFLTLGAPLLALAAAGLHREMALFRRWWLALWLVLVTHPLLDAMTVYGTQLLQPFTDHPFAVGSVFIIDPLYTLPLLVGVVVALLRPAGRGMRWNRAGLLLSTLYLGWSFAAQQHVTQVARASLHQSGIDAQQLLVTSAPFSTLLWRVVAITPTHYVEGYRGLLDDGTRILWSSHDRGAALYARHRERLPVARVAAFSKGFFSVAAQDGRLLVTDLRMGMEPAYFFRFDVGPQDAPSGQTHAATQQGARPDPSVFLPWLGRRMRGEVLPSPALALR